jgi:hypothetical protein
MHECTYRGAALEVEELPELEVDEDVSWLCIVSDDFYHLIETVQTREEEGHALFVITDKEENMLAVAKSQEPSDVAPGFLEIERVFLVFDPEPANPVFKELPEEISLGDFREILFFNTFVAKGPPVKKISGDSKVDGVAFVTIFQGDFQVIDFEFKENHFEKMKTQYEKGLREARDARGDPNWKPSMIHPGLEREAFLRAYETLINSATQEDWAQLFLKMGSDPGVKNEFYNQYSRTYAHQQDFQRRLF